jgi:hypothetical protein
MRRAVVGLAPFVVVAVVYFAVTGWRDDPAPPAPTTTSTSTTSTTLPAGVGAAWELLPSAADVDAHIDLVLFAAWEHDLRAWVAAEQAAAAQTARNARNATAASMSHATVHEAPTAPPVPSDGSVWDRLAGCESGGDWSTNTGNGYYGGLQFSAASWRGVGGTGLPHEHTRGEQIARAEALLAVQGWGAWPGCARRLGLG